MFNASKNIIIIDIEIIEQAKKFYNLITLNNILVDKILFNEAQQLFIFYKKNKFLNLFFDLGLLFGQGLLNKNSCVIFIQKTSLSNNFEFNNSCFFIIPNLKSRNGEFNYFFSNQLNQEYQKQEVYVDDVLANLVNKLLKLIYLDQITIMGFTGKFKGDFNLLNQMLNCNNEKFNILAESNMVNILLEKQLNDEIITKLKFSFTEKQQLKKLLIKANCLLDDFELKHLNHSSKSRFIKSLEQKIAYVSTNIH